MTLYPFGYGTELCHLDELVDRFADPMHPEYRRRLFAYLESCEGRIGIGSAWRPTPDPVSSASAQGKSFHQDQRFASGWVGIAAIDAVCPVPGAVHRAPTWSEVPAQGSDLASVWGIHANVSGEPWHLQPVEIDGYQTWCDHGRRDPVAGYPCPTPNPKPDPEPDPEPAEDDEMKLYACVDQDNLVWVGDGVTRRRVVGSQQWNLMVKRSTAGSGPTLYFAVQNPGQITDPQSVVGRVLQGPDLDSLGLPI